MATSSKAKKTSAKPTTKNTWKRNKGEELELPSGNVALVKRPGMETFLQEGLIPDTLMPLINEAIAKGKGAPPEKLAEATKDPKVIIEMMDAMDRVVAKVVIEPKVLWHKDSEGNEIPETDRDEDLIYTDDVVFEDKSFIFNYAVGGTRDLERFRSEAQAGLESVQNVSGVRDETG